MTQEEVLMQENPRRFVEHGWYFEYNRQEWHHYDNGVLVETLPADARPVETARMRQAAADGVL